MHLHIEALAADRTAEWRRAGDRGLTTVRGRAERGPGSVRRRLAAALAAVSRASASGVRRLDACVADDPGSTARHPGPDLTRQRPGR